MSRGKDGVMKRLNAATAQGNGEWPDSAGNILHCSEYGVERRAEGGGAGCGANVCFILCRACVLDRESSRPLWSSG